MFNFSGIVFRIWGVCGIIFLVGVVCVIIGNPKKNGFKKCSFGFIAIVLAVVLCGFYVTRIIFPSISAYTGEFIQENRNSRVAPPLPVTTQYVFWNGEGLKEVVYLDSFSKANIFPNGSLEIGKEYTVYYDKMTHVIVAINDADS